MQAFDISRLRKITVELTENCQAACPQCMRYAEDGSLNPAVGNYELDAEAFSRMNLKDRHLEEIIFQGNYGEPLININIDSILTEIRSQTYARISINSNASLRTLDWWESLARRGNVQVIFGIDGLEDTHSIYRRNTDWNKIIQRAARFIKAGGVATWKMIVFKHNEHQIKQCQDLAEDMGFDRFVLADNWRFPVDRKSISYKGTVLESSSFNPAYDRLLPSHGDPVTVTCGAHRQELGIFVDARQQVWPCCFLAGTSREGLHPWQRVNDLFFRKNFSEDYLGRCNLKNHSLEEIFSLEIWQDMLEKNFTKIDTCIKMCGSHV